MDWMTYVDQNTDEVRDEMRGWLMDCGIGDDELAEMDDADVWYAVENAYSGGVSSFVYDAFLTGEV